jgi:hypothetical protein
MTIYLVSFFQGKCLINKFTMSVKIHQNLPKEKSISGKAHNKWPSNTTVGEVYDYWQGIHSRSTTALQSAYPDINNPTIKNLLEEARKQGFNEGFEENLKEGREEGRKEGLEEGLEEGRKEGREKGLEKVRKAKIYLAKLSLKQGRNIETISSSLTLTCAEIEKLANEIKECGKIEKVDLSWLFK